MPAYNEEQGIERFHKELCPVLDGGSILAEILYVNDGSSDSTIDVLYGIADQDDRVRIINLSRNHGKEIALTAGLDHADGDAVIPMDADLQHPPEVIPEFISKWHEGYDVVYAVRRNRNEERFIKKTCANLFYRIMSRLGGRVQIPPHAGAYRLGDPATTGNAARGC